MIVEILSVVVSLFVVATLVVVVLAIRKPDRFRYVRSTRIAAPPTKVFPHLDDFHAWAEWSPWEKLDPAMTKTYGGAARGVGATYAWKGNKKVGEGKMEILSSTPPTKLEVRLLFVAPFPADNRAVFTLTPEGDGTHLEWAMEGASPFASKLFSVFVDMETLLGKDFDRGLTELKRLSEAA